MNENIWVQFAAAALQGIMSEAGGAWNVSRARIAAILADRLYSEYVARVAMQWDKDKIAAYIEESRNAQ